MRFSSGWREIYLSGHRCRGICARFLCRQAQGGIRDDPFYGNFYEAVIVALKNVLKFRKILKQT